MQVIGRPLSSAYMSINPERTSRSIARILYGSKRTAYDVRRPHTLLSARVVPYTRARRPGLATQGENADDNGKAAKITQATRSSNSSDLLADKRSDTMVESTYGAQRVF